MSDKWLYLDSELHGKWILYNNLKLKLMGMMFYLNAWTSILNQLNANCYFKDFEKLYFANDLQHLLENIY